MSVYDIETRVRTIIADVLGMEEDEVRRDCEIVEDLGADSLDVAEMILAAKQEFQIAIPEEDFPNLKYVSGAMDYIKERAK